MTEGSLLVSRPNARPLSNTHLRSTHSGLHAGWEFEGCDPSMKIKVSVRANVLIDIRAVVGRVDGDPAVVTPPVSAIERTAGL
jgi:hypothetical protein